MPRSICVHPDHRATVTSALARQGFLTQGDLAANTLIALSTVSRFFRGIRISIANFEQLCEALDLEPKAVMLSLPDETSENASASPSANALPFDAPESIQFFAYDPLWVGRDSLIATLTQKLAQNCRLLLLTGLAGIGKTALSERLSTELQIHNRYRLLRENFDNQELSADFGSFAVRLLEGCGQPVLPEERSQSGQLTRRLVAHLQTTPTLILIDSLEQILQGDEQTGWSEFIDPNFVTFFQAVLASETFQSRFVLTSQELPAQLVEAGSRYLNLWHRQPIGGLSTAEQQALFEKTGFAADHDLARIGKAYEGHPLALRTILGEIGDRPFFGNVRAYWKRYGQEIESVEQSIAEAAAGNTAGADDKWQLERFTRALRRNVQHRLEKTFERLHQDARYAYILLCETAVYRCPVPEAWWLSHLEDWQQDDNQSMMALDVLRDRYLVEEMIEDTELLLKQHNLIRSVSLAHLKQLTFEA
ncbi:MAG: AAA ATPase domain/Helix-turn-helix [Phormidesmis priestleyi Ana]|uniref:AAA ATPase domain/Helix-turn-helix n=1 Tax=Phormidesmis priestleyi Ana TaxID=1666911 RepID=A0A0P8BW11_9CYAN|nr:MAG: AAA ATPase domain/Helix-turn-helix [Phormidesmis priestleyi Ana]